MDFQGHLKNTIDMMKEEFIVLFVGGLILQLLISLTLGILAGPLMAGYIVVMIHWLKTEEPCEFNDLFAGMRRFADFFSIFFLMLLLLLGYMMLVVPGIVMTVWWMYVLFLMADKGMPLGEAMSASKEKVGEKGFFMHLVFMLMISVVPTMLLTVIAAIVPPLAVLQYFLFPLQCACMTSLYLEQFDEFAPSARGTVAHLVE
jgi:hypothetical protein